MSKYKFIPYRKVENVLYRLYVYPFLVVYLAQISALTSKILSISEKISLTDILNFVVYVINYALKLNVSNNYEVANNIINGTLHDTSATVNNTLAFDVSMDSHIMSDELKLIMENIPLKYIIGILLTFLLNIFIFLMTIWNLNFKCSFCYKRVIKKDKLGLEGVSHILVRSKKYATRLCPLIYITCVEISDNVEKKLKKLGFKSLNISKLNNFFLVQIDSIEYEKRKNEIESIIKSVNKNEKIVWFKQVSYEKKTFIYNDINDEDSESVKLIKSHESIGFCKLKYPIDLKLKEYVDQILVKGGLCNKDIKTNNIYGINNYEIPTEKFFDLFFEQIVSPFFLFQIFCVLLWILDEYWQMSLFTLFMLCTLEAQMVLRRIKESEELKKMRRPQCSILVCRDKEWKYVTTDSLLPGDIFAISPNCLHNDNTNSDNLENDVTCISPCDFLLLSGNITVNEAMLTGECTPKMKVSVNINKEDNDYENFCIDKYKNHVVFAGTNIILSRSTTNEKDALYLQTKKISNEYTKNLNARLNSITDKERSSYMKYDKSDMICIGYVLKTGFNTYQGKLIRTISSSNEKISSNSIESLLFLTLLIICSLIASSYILYYGLYDNSRNKFKLIISCIHIITSVIPPEFPITLSIAVTMTVVQLTKKRIYCTEPFRIPYSGKLNICAFDKTGTLTSDKMNLHGLFGLSMKGDEGENSLSTYSSIIFDENNVESIPFLSDIIMGCCNGLSLNGTSIIGDPMEKLIKKTSSWRVNKNENVYYSKLYNSHFNILKRFPFSPENQRMSVIGEANISINNINNVNNNTRKYSNELTVPNSNKCGLVLSKGSPEVMVNYFDKHNLDIDKYKKTVHECTKDGYRILALGAKYIDIDKMNKNRDYYESNLVFCGFLALYCPIKKHSKDVIEELNNSGHRSIMITGDNILTAFHVAKKVSITDKSDMVILSKCDNLNLEGLNEDCKNNYVWRYSNGDLYSELRSECDKEFKIQLEKINNSYCIGMNGKVFQDLTQNNNINSNKIIIRNIFGYCKVYARMSPKDKQNLINIYNNMGNTTLMCGDGTNDVGALKHSNVGISLLPNQIAKEENVRKNKSVYDIKKEIEERIRKGEQFSKLQIQRELLKELQNMDDVPKVKLGDASIASPFTYKGDSPNCIIKLVRYGRSTLTNLLLMYKLMGLNSIVSAFSMSVLAYDGVKFGDFQTTVESIIMSGLFFLILRNKPIKKLVINKPPNSIFNPFVFLSFMFQAVLHLFIIYYGWRLTGSYVLNDGNTKNIDGPFEPNIVNTTMYYLYTACHLSCFLSNANGYPFTTHILNNKYLIYISTIVISFLFVTILGLFPSINSLFSLVLYEDSHFKLSILLLVFVDMVGTYLVNYALNSIYLYKDAKKKVSINTKSAP
ncbi:hypothetical protein RS030_162531 [Cryptosporidium xiaoi]|uniref:Uncharacterized protein n=1 Tax=Cryptosporidium xiaoi TaxID=659607 RepID=A0AAV9XZY2_9CRYT